MPTPTINDYLKYANLQMAAEAFLVNEDGSVKTDLKQALIDIPHKGTDHVLFFKRDFRSRPSRISRGILNWSITAN